VLRRSGKVILQGPGGMLPKYINREFIECPFIETAKVKLDATSFVSVALAWLD
jgi:hypothetical protein